MAEWLLYPDSTDFWSAKSYFLLKYAFCVDLLPGPIHWPKCLYILLLGNCRNLTWKYLLQKKQTQRQNWKAEDSQVFLCWKVISAFVQFLKSTYYLLPSNICCKENSFLQLCNSKSNREAIIQSSVILCKNFWKLQI